ncbi:PepSY domain-containing protein [Silicimonas algicola]|uniref:YpeB-like protein with putative protease inhibitory function n=1 Tax=Silicimonas algicola TaxID=1826607 RepID=A0A316G8R7_9RHOB|nr:PepSY domain-containing protein [Silicimonas algicola]AZQ69333.1 PepSY domain-containing protein [Silicimonas algicola]PWK56396.1 YpeB-like protein with putative protease inhibitory function [Silicimonas algicola]
MFKTLIAPALVAALLATGAFAANSVELTDANTNHIRQLLTEQGYEVAKIKIEDGMYEAYAKKDGSKFEVFLDAAFEIVEVKNDD